MYAIATQRRAVATVVTTMIILVASVVLGTGLVLYGSSIFKESSQIQSINTHGIKIWVNATDPAGTAWGAAAIRNNGDKFVLVDTILVRGTPIPWSNLYYANSTNSLANSQDTFVYGTNDGSGILKTYLGNPPSTDSCNPVASLKIDVDGTGPKPMICMIQATGPISLRQGDNAIIYFHLPNGIFSSVDVGTKTTVAIYSGKVGAPATIIVGTP